jgi:hypothetical protein
MKVTWLVVVWACVCGVAAYGQLTPDDLIKAVDQMTPAQVNEFQQKLDAKLWKPVPEGFFTRMSADVGVSGSSLDTVDLGSLTLSGGKMDVESVSGVDLGLLWRVGDGDRFRLGVRFGGWGAIDSNLAEAGYSRAELTGGYLKLAANYQLIRSKSCLVWAEIAPGAGSVTMDTVDTPTGQPSTLRSFDGSFGQVDFQAGASWRFNPILSLFLSGGYRWAESVDLEEGGKTRDAEFDASGFVGKFGLGVNY